MSAHRQTWLDSGSINFTPQGRNEFEGSLAGWDRSPESRWKEIAPGERQSAVLYDLVARENSRARSIAHLVDMDKTREARDISKQLSSPFDQLNALLELGALPISIQNSNDEEILAHHRDSDIDYSIVQMSDGERSAVIIASHVLTVEPGTIFLIDEPERHLHRSIIAPFLSALFERRRDCTFVVSTHEVELPLAYSDADVLLLRSCKWIGDKSSSWDAECLPTDAQLPDELKLAVLGARRRVLFVEGTSGSLDRRIYSVLFPGIHVMPARSASDVQRAVIGLAGTRSHHHVDAYGLIDGDGRTAEKAAELQSNSVFALERYSVEAFYYCTDSIAAVAKRQAESLQCDAQSMIDQAICDALLVLGQEAIAETMAARRCEHRLRYELLSRIPHWESFRSNEDPIIRVCIESPYPHELSRFRGLLAKGNFDGLVARYPLHKTPTFSRIALALRCKSEDDYKRMVLARLARNGALARLLRQSIAPLAQALGFHDEEPDSDKPS